MTLPNLFVAFVLVSLLGVLQQAAANHTINWPRNKPYSQGTQVALASAKAQKRIGRISVRVGSAGAAFTLVALVIQRLL